jgi:hypothetical protein
MSKEILEKIDKTEVKNILAKLNKGGTLSTVEKGTVKKHFGGATRKPLTYLNAKQLVYCRERADGNQTQVGCYRTAYPGVSIQAAKYSANKLDKNPMVIAKIKKLQDATETKSTLSRQEKRETLARVVRMTPREMSMDSSIVDSVVILKDAEGNVKKITYKCPSKIAAIEVDNKMAGHNEPEQHEHTHKSGVMMMPNSGKTLGELEKDIIVRQRALKDKVRATGSIHGRN